MATKTLEQIDASLSRWKTRLRRAMTAIDKLEKQRKRLVRATAVRVSVPAHPTVDSETTLGTVPPKPEPVKVTAPSPVADEIPAFLRRQSDGGLEATRQRSLDADAAERIKSEIAATKQAKARGRIAKMKAKQSGETRRMPLTGKAALAAIRG